MTEDLGVRMKASFVAGISSRQVQIILQDLQNEVQRYQLQEGELSITYATVCFPTAAVNAFDRFL